MPEEKLAPHIARRRELRKHWDVIVFGNKRGAKGYNPGEKAGFPPERALALVKTGVATYVDKDKQKAFDDAKETQAKAEAAAEKVVAKKKAKADEAAKPVKPSARRPSAAEKKATAEADAKVAAESAKTAEAPADKPAA